MPKFIRQLPYYVGQETWNGVYNFNSCRMFVPVTSGNLENITGPHPSGRAIYHIVSGVLCLYNGTSWDTFALSGTFDSPSLTLLGIGNVTPSGFTYRVRTSVPASIDIQYSTNADLSSATTSAGATTAAQIRLP